MSSVGTYALDEYEQRLGTAAIPIARMPPVSSCSVRPAGCCVTDCRTTCQCNRFRGGRFCRVIGACAFRWSTPMTVPRRYRGLSTNALRARSTLLPNRQSDETM